MTPSEFRTVVKAMKSIWTKDNFLPDDYSVNLWYQLLKDLNYQDVHRAVIEHASQSKWSPSIAELRARVATAQMQVSDWSDGWSQVLRAIRNYGYTREAEALESMDAITAKIVKRLGWQYICQSEQEELKITRANFRMIYEELKETARNESALPARLKENKVLPEVSRLAETLGG